MIRPQKMKQVELTVLAKDVDRVIEFLGRRALMQFSGKGESTEKEEVHTGQDGGIPRGIQECLEQIKIASAYLGIELPLEPEETSILPGDPEKALTEQIVSAVGLLSAEEHTEETEKQRLAYTLSESRAFVSLNASFKDLDRLSYLTLRIGRLDPKGYTEIKKNLEDRAVFIPLGGDRIVSAASRDGQFALDSELKKHSFVPIAIPEGFQGLPAEIIVGLEDRLKEVDQKLEHIGTRKIQLRDEYGPKLQRLAGSYLMASLVEELKGKLVATRNVFLLSGWIPAGALTALVRELSGLTEGRIGVRTFNPDEVEAIRRGSERVPVSLKHGAFVRSFQGLVLSYSAPLYGTIDPTPFVAFFFMIFFGIMFGDLGQGFVLLILGILSSKRGIKAMANFRGYSSPLIAVSITSMIMGLLTGSVFANEELLVKPTRKVLGFFMSLLGQTGEPPDRILHLMPDADNMEKLFYFFGFTLGLGIILNSIGLWINVINQFTLKRYDKAVFSKTGLVGVAIFWYALFIGIRCLLGGGFTWFDLGILGVLALCIFFGPVIWGLISGKRPLLHEGLLVFIIEGFVEILETLSAFTSNTVSFLRVGAFALSHTVLSFIIFTLSAMASHIAGGPLFSFIIMLIGNLVIILLEGMIVAIQVVRLQYYEFFSKFFAETGVEFAPFRFRRKAVSDEVRGIRSPILSENSD